MANQSIAPEKQAEQSRNIMIFILVMSMSGLEGLIAELMPELEIGLLELGVSTFYFVPLSLVVLFGSWWAALAVPVGEIVFSDLILGEFGGLGEMEEVFLTTFALYIAARIVRDPSNGRQVLIAGLVGYLIAEAAATFVDIFKVWVGVEELEAVEGLPESIVVLESIDFAVEYVISGILLGAIPAMALAPRLHGKIEPLMGLEPKRPDDPQTGTTNARLWLIGILFVALAVLTATVSEIGINLVEWEPEFLDTIGEWFIWVPIAVSLIVAIAILATRPRSRSGNDQ